MPSMINRREMPGPISEKWTLVEFKIVDTSDPFLDPEDPLQPKSGNFRFENDSDEARLVRGQLASYCCSHGASVSRSYFLCIVCGKYARFIRWDRDGATVTRRFDYIKEPYFLTGFFWHHEHLDHHQQGYNTSVSSVTPEDIEQIRHFESHLRDNNPPHREFRVLIVPDRDDPKSKSDSSYHFFPSTRLAHRSDVPLDRCWLMILRQKTPSS